MTKRIGIYMEGYIPLLYYIAFLLVWNISEIPTYLYLTSSLSLCNLFQQILAAISLFLWVKWYVKEFKWYSFVLYYHPVCCL